MAKKSLKFYVKSGKCKRLLLAPSALKAAVACVQHWQQCKNKLGTSVRVSEVGFDGDHPHHENDNIIAMNFIRAKMKS